MSEPRGQAGWVQTLALLAVLGLTLLVITQVSQPVFLWVLERTREGLGNTFGFVAALLAGSLPTVLVLILLVRTWMWVSQQGDDDG